MLLAVNIFNIDEVEPVETFLFACYGLPDTSAKGPVLAGTMYQENGEHRKCMKLDLPNTWCLPVIPTRNLCKSSGKLETQMVLMAPEQAVIP
jgi:hypothetical protein